MRALVKQSPAYQAEVWKESDWQPWVDPVRMSTWPNRYALAQEAPSPYPWDYVITEHREEDEFGDLVITYTAEMTQDDDPQDA